MTRRKATVAAVALVPALAYELAEIARGDDGWPYSRFIRRVPMPVRVGALVLVTGWLWPHLLKDPLKHLSIELEVTS